MVIKIKSAYINTDTANMAGDSALKINNGDSGQDFIKCVSHNQHTGTDDTMFVIDIGGNIVTGGEFLSYSNVNANGSMNSNTFSSSDGVSKIEHGNETTWKNEDSNDDKNHMTRTTGKHKINVYNSNFSAYSEVQPT